LLLPGLPPMPLTSPPAQNASPAPVMRSAPIVGSSPHCLIMRRSAGVRLSESELRACGRLSVMTATRSRTMQSSSSVPVSMMVSDAVAVAVMVAVPSWF